MKNKTIHTTPEFPNLENLKSQNGFETPEGYFDSLHDSIMNEVNEQTKVKRLPLYKIVTYAASVLVLVGISSLLFFSNPNESEDYEYVYDSLVNYNEITVDEYTAEFTEVDLELDENLQFDEIALF